MLSEYAIALAGMLQPPAGTGTSRVVAAASEGGPKAPRKPFAARVSTTRHGVTGTNWSPAPATGENAAVSVIGPFMVTLADAVVPVNEPGPEPVQPVKTKPALGAAEIPTTVPGLKKEPLAGLTAPPPEEFIHS